MNQQGWCFFFLSEAPLDHHVEWGKMRFGDRRRRAEDKAPHKQREDVVANV